MKANIYMGDTTHAMQQCCFYESWHYLKNHPIFCDEFEKCLDIEIVKVNPVNKMVEDDDSLNTLTQVWLECGPYQKDCLTHDIDLDCGGDTFEEAIINLSKLVNKFYGNEEDKALEKVKNKYTL